MKVETLAAGTVVGDRFVVGELAGSGGMGAVHRARDQQTGRMVALKVLHGSGGPELARFAREAAVLASLEHPGIVRYIEHGVTSAGAPYLAMDWVEGEELGKLLKRRALTEAEALAIARSTAHALAAAHALGIVHRDLKPNNLMIGARGSVTLFDFGVALLASRNRLTRVGDVVGTPAYMSPEQARAEKIDARSDVFSLGCVLYKCLTGHSPFGGGNVLGVMTKILLQDPPPPSASVDGVSAEVDALVARMLAKDPSARPANGAAVVEAIDGLSRSSASRGVPSARIGGAERSLFTVLLVERTRATMQEVTRIAATYDMRLDLLQTGAIVVTPNSTGTFVDRAIRTARFAVALRRYGDGRMALVMGLGTSAGSLPAAEVIDRGVELLRKTRDDRVRIDDDSAQILEGAFDVERDAASAVLVSERPPFESARTLLGRETPIVERERELEYLERTMRLVSEERSVAWVWLTGPAGRGKTRIAYEFLRRMAGSARPVEILGARADASNASTPYAFLTELLRSATYLRDGDSTARRREKLAARLQRHLSGPDATSAGTFLGELVGAPLCAENDLQLVAARRDPALLTKGLARAFETWLAAETSVTPLLLVLEDAHFVDAPTHRLLTLAARALSDRPLMILALARDDGRERFATADGASVLAVPPLSKRAAAELVAAVLGDDAEPSVVRQLVHAAAGSVLHLEELMRAHARGAEPSEVGVVAAMQARIEALTPAARRVLRALSVFGLSADVAAVAAVTGDELPEATRELDALVAAEVLARRARAPSELAFLQASLRDAVYATFTAEDRRLAHRLAAEFLERVRADFDVLADHYARAAVPDREGFFSARAAEQAFARNDLEAAMARAQRALALGIEEQPMLVLLAEARRHRGEFVAGYEDACRATALAAHGTSMWCEALGARSALAGLLSKYDEASVIVDELLLTPVRADAIVARRRALARAALAMMPSGRMAAVDRVLAELDRDPPQLADDPALVARVEGLRGTRASYAGEYARYLRASAASVQAFEQAGDARGACIQRVHVGYAALSIGDYVLAEKVLREAAENARALDLPNIAAAARHNLGAVLARAGRSEEAIAILEDVIGVFVEQRDVAMIAATSLYLAEAMEHAGRGDDAERMVDLALAAGDVPSLRGAILALRARLFLARGAIAEAAEAAEDAATALSSVEGVEEGESSIRLALAETRRARSDPRAAESLRIAVARVRERAAAIDDPHLRACFLAITENARTLSLAR